MFLRKLTDAEIAQIKKAKDAVKDQRQKLQQDIKRQRKRIQDETKRLKGKPKTLDMFQTLNTLRDHLTTTENQRNALPIVTGLPVIVKLEDRHLCLNYELLKKFDRLLDRSNLYCTSIKIDKCLIVHYEKHGHTGTAEFGELTYQLDGLPIIDLKEGAI